VRFWRTPFDTDTIPRPRGEIHLIPERCKECGFCVTYCPRGVLTLSEHLTNSKGYHLPETVAEEQCVACGLCELICPEFAIYCVEIAGVPNE
jgi:2-oxoglutarate ferredoxin oxidoreductase subunit delta